MAGKLTFVVGRSKNGKTGKLLANIKNHMKDNNGSLYYLVVPDQATFLYEGLLLDALGGNGFIDIEVVSFSRLMERIIENTGLRGQVPIDSTGKSIILGKVMRELKSSGEYFGKSSNTLGFLAKMTDTLDELALCGIDSTKLEEISQNIDDQALKFKMDEISKVYSGYSEFVENIFCDQEKLYEISTKKIEKDDEFTNAKVFVDGFFSYSHQEKEMLKAFLMNNGEVQICALYDPEWESSPDGHIFEPSLRLIREMSLFAAENMIDVKMDNLFLENDERPADIRHLEKNIYSWPGTSFEDKTEAITIEKCKSIFDEVERGAVRISRLVRDEDVAYSDVAVICGDIRLYAPIIKRIFRDFEIPVFIDDKRPIKFYPIVKAITAALETINSNYGSDSIYRLMKSGMFDLRRNKIEKLEIFAMENGIKYKKWTKPFEIESLEETRKWVVDPLEKLKKNISKSKTAKEFTESICNYMENMSFAVILNNKIQELTQMGELEVASEYAQAWNGVMKVFDQIVEVCGDHKLSLKEYIDLLKDGFESHKAGIIPVASDKVTIGDLQRSVLGEIDHLIIFGFNDGNIPSISTQSSIISSRDKEMLRGFGIKLNSEISEINKLEALRIYSALSGPRKSLTLSYTISKLEGEAASASLIIDRLFLLKDRIFKNAQVNSFDLDRESHGLKMSMINNPISTLKELAVMAGTHGFEDDENAMETIWMLSNESIWAEKIKTIFQGRIHDNSFDKVDDELAVELFKPDMKTSISRLEKFRKCPFSHLVRYGIRPNEQREFEIKSEDLGNVYHRVMERFGQEILGNRDILKNSEMEIGSEVEHIVDDEIRKLQDIRRISDIFLETGVGKYAVRKMKRFSLTAAQALISHIERGQFMPKLFEAEFGTGEEAALKPIIIDCGEKGTIILEGRIDRIDIADDNPNNVFVRVVDYKSGNLTLDASEVIEGTKLQLIHYLNATIENAKAMGYDSLKPAGAFYFRINDPLLSKENGDLESIKDEIKGRLAMNGITVNDESAIFANDRFIGSEDEQDDDFEVISDLKKELKKAGKAGSSKVITGQELERLIGIAKTKTGEICSQILDGYSKIQPLTDSGVTACTYCQYSSICQFDTSIKGNGFLKVKKYSTEEIKNILSGEGGEPIE